MDVATSLTIVLLVALAAANGSNDVPKGVATLAGAGVTKYRTAILWGTVTTMAGGLFSLTLASKMTQLFSKGIVDAPETAAFTIAVLAGASAWVALATVAKLPVSTTHALVGALLGAGLLLPAGSVNGGVVGAKIVTPLLLSIAVAYLLSLALSLIPVPQQAECICVELTPTERTGPGGVATPEGMVLYSGTAIPTPRVATGSMAECSRHGGRRFSIVDSLHWVSSGATSFARGLNDTPKIVAVGAFSLVPAGMTRPQLLVVVVIAMVAGSLAGGLRVARRLGEGVVRMSHVEGFKANLTSSVLVGLGATQGLPMSTTHVTTGAIVGAAGRNTSRLNGRTLRDFLIAWTVTPVVAGLVGAAVYLVSR